MKSKFLSCLFVNICAPFIARRHTFLGVSNFVGVKQAAAFTAVESPGVESAPEIGRL